MSEKAKVYFSKEISPEKVLEMYQLLGKKLDGRVAIKLHSGEAGNQNFLKPEFWKPVIDHVGGTVVECNTAYEGERNTTTKHKKTLEAHGWSRYFKVDLLDAEGPDLELAIPNGKVIQKNFVGKDIADYDSLPIIWIMILRSSFPISRDIQWGDTAERSNSFRSALHLPPARHIFMVQESRKISGRQTTTLSWSLWRMRHLPLSITLRGMQFTSMS